MCCSGSSEGGQSIALSTHAFNFSRAGDGLGSARCRSRRSYDFHQGTFVLGLNRPGRRPTLAWKKGSYMLHCQEVALRKIGYADVGKERSRSP